jgi:hypothetical protein
LSGGVSDIAVQVVDQPHPSGLAVLSASSEVGAQPENPVLYHRVPPLHAFR